MVKSMSVAGHVLTALPRLQYTVHEIIAADMRKDAFLQVQPLRVTAQPSQMSSQIRMLQQSPLPARPPPRSAKLLSPSGHCQPALRQQPPCQRLWTHP